MQTLPGKAADSKAAKQVSDLEGLSSDGILRYGGAEDGRNDADFLEDLEPSDAEAGFFLEVEALSNHTSYMDAVEAEDDGQKSLSTDAEQGRRRKKLWPQRFPVRDPRPAGEVLAGESLEKIARATLEAHNAYRRKHGAPPLKWSKRCYEHAAKRARICQQLRRMQHGNTGSVFDRMGQNIYWQSNGAGARAAVTAWYSEASMYNFRKPGYQRGTGHFTQLVWKKTRYVGLAFSPDGRYLVANYFPSGNYRGQFKLNVEKH
jgi:uncharacterized protein YkwD